MQFASSLLIIAMLAAQATAGFGGRCIRVVDGDTLDVQVGNEVRRVRLAGIDAPEKNQPFGLESKAYLEAHAVLKEVILPAEMRDRYGRWVSDVILPGNRSLSRGSLRWGFSWEYKAYSKDPKLASLEATARKEKRGLWSVTKPIPPWDWRRGKRS